MHNGLEKIKDITIVQKHQRKEMVRRFTNQENKGMSLVVENMEGYSIDNDVTGR